MSQAFETLISYGIKRNKPNMRLDNALNTLKSSTEPIGV
mgnify:FL=1